ncbi:MAG: cyclic nucleotide-binding domain-containing protein [Chloroflexota bacterium]
MNKIDVLKKCTFFSDLTDEQLKHLAGMASTQTFEVGEALAKQGRTQDKMYVIEDGLVGLYLELGPMTHRQLQAASNCDVVGWSAMLPPHRSTTTAKAIETTKVLVFHGTDLIGLCHTMPPIGCKVHRGLASVVAERLHYAYTQLMGVTSQE